MILEHEFRSLTVLYLQLAGHELRWISKLFRVQWILKTLHDPEYRIYGVLKCYSIVRSCRIFGYQQHLAVVSPSAWLGALHHKEHEHEGSLICFPDLGVSAPWRICL